MLRYKGTVDLSMDVHKFPYDSQQIVMLITSYTCPIAECEFIPLSTNTSTPEQMMLMTNNVDLPEWDVLRPIEVTHEIDSSWDLRDYSQLRTVVYIRRRPQFYLSKVISLIVIIALMSVGAMVLPPDQLNDRFQVTLTLLLTQIAFNFVINEALPKVSYVTSLDKYFLSNYLLLVLEYSEHIFSYLVYTYWSESTAKLMDEISIAFALFWVMAITAAFVIACFSGPPAMVRKHVQRTRTTPESPRGEMPGLVKMGSNNKQKIKAPMYKYVTY